MIDFVVFFSAAIIVIVSAVCVVSLRNIFHSILSLYICFLGVAGIYLTLNADFLFATQILIYAGGIIVLILFAVMLTEKTGERKHFISGNKLLPLVLSIFLFITITLVNIFTSYTLAGSKKNIPSTKIIGEILLSKYLLPFEIASFILVVAIIGATIFVREDNGTAKKDISGSCEK